MPRVDGLEVARRLKSDVMWSRTPILMLTSREDEAARRQAGYKLANDYRRALLDEPMPLVEHIVRNDRPFTEVVTADYIMVTPYTVRGYGIFDEVRDRFEDADDYLEYIPVKLKALKGRSRGTDQESATGDYPHAGILSTFQYLRRYPTTETNRNRLRARMYYLHFLGVDALELAARVSDAAAVTAASIPFATSWSTWSSWSFVSWPASVTRARKTFRQSRFSRALRTSSPR